jgi:hypothetical protein
LYPGWIDPLNKGHKYRSAPVDRRRRRSNAMPEQAVESVKEDIEETKQKAKEGRG